MQTASFPAVFMFTVDRWLVLAFFLTVWCHKFIRLFPFWRFRFIKLKCCVVIRDALVRLQGDVRLLMWWRRERTRDDRESYIEGGDGLLEAQFLRHAAVGAYGLWSDDENKTAICQPHVRKRRNDAVVWKPPSLLRQSRPRLTWQNHNLI